MMDNDDNDNNYHYYYCMFLGSERIEDFYSTKIKNNSKSTE